MLILIHFIYISGMLGLLCSGKPPSCLSQVHRMHRSERTHLYLWNVFPVARISPHQWGNVITVTIGVMIQLSRPIYSTSLVYFLRKDIKKDTSSCRQVTPVTTKSTNKDDLLPNIQTSLEKYILLKSCNNDITLTSTTRKTYFCSIVFTV